MEPEPDDDPKMIRVKGVPFVVRANDEETAIVDIPFPEPEQTPRLPEDFER